MIIRQVVDNDFEALKKIENECFINPWKDKDIIYEMNDNPINNILVMEDDNKIIGFIDYMITFNSSTISQIAICKEYRQKGLASKLLDAMEESFIKSGEEKVEFVTLEVRVSNIAAQNLYKKHGYEIITTKKHYYQNGEDALYMVKRID